MCAPGEKTDMLWQFFPLLAGRLMSDGGLILGIFASRDTRTHRGVLMVLTLHRVASRVTDKSIPQFSVCFFSF